MSLINCATLSQTRSVEPKLKKQFSLKESGPLLLDKKIEFAGVLLKMIYCLPANKDTALWTYWRDKRRSWNKTPQNVFQSDVLCFQLVITTLREWPWNRFFCFLPFWNEESLNACILLTYCNRNAFFVVILAKINLFLSCRIQYHGHHVNCSNHDYHDHHDSHIITHLFQERYRLSLSFIDILNTGH